VFLLTSSHKVSIRLVYLLLHALKIVHLSDEGIYLDINLLVLSLDSHIILDNLLMSLLELLFLLDEFLNGAVVKLIKPA
jgi:hypothetical protein